VMEDSSTALALKWFESALDYNSAKAILDKGDAITETDVAPFLKTETETETETLTDSDSDSDSEM
jgi:hypothetical protein